MWLFAYIFKHHEQNVNMVYNMDIQYGSNTVPGGVVGLQLYFLSMQLCDIWGLCVRKPHGLSMLHARSCAEPAAGRSHCSHFRWVLYCQHPLR